MELVSTKTLQLFSGSGNRELAEEIAESLGVPLGDVELSTFANGEKYCRLGENVRGSDVFVLQGHCEPINDHMMEQLIMIDALEARVGPAHHRGLPVLRLRPPGPEGRRVASPSPRACSPTCSPSPAPTASSWSTCTRARSRASSTSPSTTSPRCRCSPTTSRRRSTATSRSRSSSPDAGARQAGPPVRELPRRARHQRRPRVHRQAPSEGHAQRRDRDRGRRRRRGPPVHPDRRHDRHRGHGRQRGRAAHEPGRGVGVDPRHPRSALRPRRSTG